MLKKSAIVIFILLIAASLSWGEKENEKTTREKRYREVNSQIKLLGEVYRELNKQYVDEIDVEEFIRAGIDGMLGTLDPYTVYYQPDQVEDLAIMTRGAYGGIGIEIGLRGSKKELTVISPIEDTPAARKGLRAGDVIIAIEGKPTSGFTTADAAKMIRGPAGTEVTLTIRRAGYDKPLDYTLEREDIRIPDVSYYGMLDGNIGYIKLSRFSKLATLELRNALVELVEQNPDGLILDLRSNPGGLLESAVGVAQQFLQPGDLIVSTHGRTARSDRKFTTAMPPVSEDVPLVVLVNGGSASASEIVSGAIQDLDRGILIGTPTFGKGLVQTVVKISEGAALKITTARYYTPSGRLIQKDHKLDEDPGTSGEIGSDLEHNPAAGEVDTTSERFTTRSGRIVYGGGGITPDITIKPEFFNDIGIELYRQDMFFSFMRDWIPANSDIDTVMISEEMIEAFYTFVDSMNFSLPVNGEKELNRLRDLGKEMKLGEDYSELLAQVEDKLTNPDRLRDASVREFIVQSLDREMASALGGREWRIRSTFDEDTVLKAALQLLRDKPGYSSLLTPTDRADAGEMPDRPAPD